MSVNCKKILSMDCSKDSKYVVMSQPSKPDTTLKVLLYSYFLGPNMKNL